MLAGGLSALMLLAVVLSDPRGSAPSASSWPVPAAVIPTERGDPDLAEALLGRVDAETDSQTALRLLVAAAVLAPDRATYRHRLARTVIDGVTPGTVTSGELGAGGPVVYAAMTANASAVVVDRTGGGQVWRTRDVRGPQVGPPVAIGGRVTAAAGSFGSAVPDLLVAGPDGVLTWVASIGLARSGARLSESADLVAMAVRGDVGLTVSGHIATLWSPDMFRPRALATLSYDRTPTVVAFAPGNDLILAAGLDDGTVRVDHIDRSRTASERLDLAGTGAPVRAVAVSADGSTVAGLDIDGALSVWRIARARRGQPVAPAGTAAVGGQGPYGLWLSPSGDYAVVSDTQGQPALWSLADPSAPQRLLELAVGGEPAVPAMVSYDGHQLVTIDQANTLTVWDLSTIVDTLADPLPRACGMAGLTDELWRGLVPDPAYTNPCPQTGPPLLGLAATSRLSELDRAGVGA